MQKRLDLVSIAVVTALASCCLCLLKPEVLLSKDIVKQHTEKFTYGKHLRSIGCAEEELPNKQNAFKKVQHDYLSSNSNLNLEQQPIALCSLPMSANTNGGTNPESLWLRQVVNYPLDNINYGHPLKLSKYQSEDALEKTIKKLALSTLDPVKNQLYRDTTKKEPDLDKLKNAPNKDDRKDIPDNPETANNPDERVFVRKKNKVDPDVGLITPKKITY